MLAKIVFFLSAASILYVYGGYFVLLRLLSFLKNKSGAAESDTTGESSRPFVSVLIAACNEEKDIGRRIENILGQSYPSDRLELIIASDGSTDDTVRIARRYENKGVKVLDFELRRGRASVHNDAVKTAGGEIVVFSDAGTIFKKDFVEKAVRNFRSPEVGGVVGKLRYVKEDGSIPESENVYLRLEFKLRELESLLGILAVGSGACLAIRKDLFNPIRKNEDVDDILPLQCIRSGHKMIMDSAAEAYDTPPLSLQEELRARIRMSSQAFRGTIRNWGLRDIVRHPCVTWGLFSHKMLRWLVPFLLLALLVSNTVLMSGSPWFLFFLLSQLFFYFLALIGLAGHLTGRRFFFASHFFSFCAANFGVMVGVLKGVFGKAPAAYD